MITPPPASAASRQILIRALLAALLILLSLATPKLPPLEQTIASLLLFVLMLSLNRAPASLLITLTMVLLSMQATLRYAWWRYTTTLHLFLHHPAHTSPVDGLFSVPLLFAETFTFVILTLGYLQTIAPLRRKPAPLPEDPVDWPAVDLLIPTWDEPLSLVRFTVLAALNLDWPPGKLNIVLLDDGAREDFRLFAEQTGIRYLERTENLHRKAGNINHALPQLHAPLLAIFDAHQVPARSFLQTTVGWFLRDPRLAILQTPHIFYSPDPFERNLDQFRMVPNESELFHSVVQDGSDLWNATLFCGSCAVLRRAALDEIGGFPDENLAGDLDTSLRLHRLGWNSACIDLPQAAGLATERLSRYVQARIRRAVGTIAILRGENPLFAPGLTLAQRLCFFHAMLHFLDALPRLIFLTAPLVFLVFGRTALPGETSAILLYALPHLAFSCLTQSRLNGAHRFSFWQEIYQTVLAPYLLFPTLLALLGPRRAHAAVPARAGAVKRSFFDRRTAQPLLLLLAFNLLGVVTASLRLLHLPLIPAFQAAQPGAVLLNLLWALFNVVILGVATAVAWESRQRRRSVRVAMAVRAEVVLPDGSIVSAETADLSSGGVMVDLKLPTPLSPGQTIELIFSGLAGPIHLPAVVVGLDGTVLRARFAHLTLDQEEALTTILYSRADTWLGWQGTLPRDRPLRSFVHIVRISARGITQLLFPSRPSARNRASRPSPRLAVLLASALFGAALLKLAQAHTASGLLKRLLDTVSIPVASLTPPLLASRPSWIPPAVLFFAIPVLAAAATILLCLLAALLLRGVLHRIAAHRLQPDAPASEVISRTTPTPTQTADAQVLSHT